MSSDLKLKLLLIYVRDITIESAKKSLKNTGLAGNKSESGLYLFCNKRQKTEFQIYIATNVATTESEMQKIWVSCVVRNEKLIFPSGRYKNETTF